MSEPAEGEVTMNPLDQLRDETANLHLTRCPICDWTLAESRDKGCVPGDCSYRPEQGSDEWHRIHARREALKAKPNAHRAAIYDDLARARIGLPPLSESERAAARELLAQPSGAPAPASAQGEVCECGHIAAIHDDPHGDGAHGGSCLEIVGKRSDGSDDFCRCSEFHHAQ